ncbi:helix-turn-helix transcriptional regulator [Poriferisphaera sp. WC338]|uniref:helix-turn-helix transcriptional regulator n=1 Tax=Poriferisphaera sp. WC338 TaxID=3425129 RepID=UPI003D81B126
MQDEAKTFKQLDSALFGSLIHAIEVTARAIGANIAAGKIFDVPGELLSSYVSLVDITLPINAVTELQTWPDDKESIFEHFYNRDLRDNILHMQRDMGVLFGENKPCNMFEHIENHHKVVDVLCLSCTLNESTWGKLIFIRCGESEPFGQSHIDTLKRFKPSIARLLLLGLKRETLPQHESYMTSFPNQNTAAELLLKLSKTERIVFDHLQTNKTERQVAEIMDRSRHTIHVYVKNIYRKLGISSRKELLQLFDGVADLEEEETLTV